MIDFDQFEESAAILEFDEGMSRFDAEAEAARRQGVQRWEAMKCEQRAKYFKRRASPSATSTATSARPARNAARGDERRKTPAYPSPSSRTASSGIAGTAS